MEIKGNELGACVALEQPANERLEQCVREVSNLVAAMERFADEVTGVDRPKEPCDEPSGAPCLEHQVKTLLERVCVVLEGGYNELERLRQALS